MDVRITMLIFIILQLCVVVRLINMLTTECDAVVDQILNANHTQLCYWMEHNTPLLPRKAMDVSLEKQLLFLDLMDASKVPYALTADSLLGALRHGGYMRHDYDLDIDIFPHLDARLNSSCLSSIWDPDCYNDIGGQLAQILFDLVNTQSKYEKISIIKKAYEPEQIKLTRNNKAEFHDAYWNSHYFVTLSQGEPFWEGEHLNYRNYPFVMDVGWGDPNDLVVTKYGPLCTCEFSGRMTSAVQFAHSAMYKTYGSTYMVPDKDDDAAITQPSLAHYHREVELKQKLKVKLASPAQVSALCAVSAYACCICYYAIKVHVP